MTCPEPHTDREEGDVVMIDRIDGFRFNPPQRFRVEHEGDGIILSGDNVGLYACGTDMQSACDDLRCELDIAWRHYVERDMNRLHATGMELRQWLLDHVERIP